MNLSLKITLIKDKDFFLDKNKNVLCVCICDFLNFSLKITLYSERCDILVFACMCDSMNFCLKITLNT